VPVLVVVPVKERPAVAGRKRRRRSSRLRDPDFEGFRQLTLKTPTTDRECQDAHFAFTKMANELEHLLRMQAIVRKNKW
jgi:hypothetical protein